MFELILYRFSKVIVASGLSDNKRVQQMQQEGAGPYIRKPFTIEKIARIVRSVLDGTATSKPNQTAVV